MSEIKNIHIIGPQMAGMFREFWKEERNHDDDTFALWLLRDYNITYLTASDEGLWVQGTERDLMMMLLKF